MSRKKYKGLHAHRLKDNPEERRFAEAWAKHDELGQSLRWLLHRGDQGGIPDEVSVRDEIVAATLMQWLGSPVGKAFLENLGYAKRGAVLLVEGCDFCSTECLIKKLSADLPTVEGTHG